MPIPYKGGDSMTYDPVHHSVLYITENLDDSGNSVVDQTWIWDPAAGSWTQQSLQTGPNVTRAMLAFDPFDGAVAWSSIPPIGLSTPHGRIPGQRGKPFHFR